MPIVWWCWGFNFVMLQFVPTVHLYVDDMILVGPFWFRPICTTLREREQVYQKRKIENSRDSDFYISTFNKLHPKPSSHDRIQLVPRSMLRKMAKGGTQIKASGSLALLIILPGSLWKKKRRQTSQIRRGVIRLQCEI